MSPAIEIGISTSSGGSVFEPTDISGAVLWLRADMGITLATGVSAWADQSVSGYDVSQAAGANQPAYNAADADINNHPSIDFDGVNDSLTNLAMSLSSASYTMFVACNPAAPSSQHWPWSMGTGAAGANEELSFCVSNVDVPHWRIDNGTTFAVDTTTTLPGWHVWSGYTDGDDHRIWVDGSEGTASSTSVTLGTIDRMRVGARSNGAPFSDTTIAEIVLYGRKLSAPERQLVERYMLTRYGLG